MTVSPPKIGTRILLSGHIGTIKFVGSVHGTTGTWLGVEWDDPQRGKHDGAKDGVQYFACAIPGTGSFIRQTPSIKYGITFTRALLSKYIEDLHGSQGQEFVVLGSSNGAIEVEAVNLDKIRNKLSHVEKLREVSLDGENVASADAPGEIGKTCPSIRGLDLARSLISSWDTIAEITRELPLLERLALSQNRFTLPSGAIELSSAFLNLQELQLNKTLLTWIDFTEYLLPRLPKLTSIELGYNRLDHLSDGTTERMPPTTNTKLSTVNFDGNSLNNWSEICLSLAKYPTVDHLVLSLNAIESIPPLPKPEGTDASALEGLAHIKSLALSFNNLRNWTDINALADHCPVLETLNITGNPIIEEKHSRAIFVAKLPALKSLNGGAAKREDCELFYLSYIVQVGYKTEEAAIAAHPRYQELRAKYGQTEAYVTPRQDNLNSRIITLNIHRIPNSLAKGSPVPEHSTPPTIIKALPSMKLQTLQQKLRKTFKVPPKAEMDVYLEMSDTVAELESGDSHDLIWWGLGEGSNLFVYIP
ncbi:hypothetical protein BDM02DRAFT_3183259 [Thelephora ganbajun]|uniref:Uncharacterized protein n=1 Tax=Thelephora ganbajun TaxID=370292 RepID=A0ACB6ZTF4_THEGA|nr:hypothetical protein BDM02DRAFT_3183259 [Thelephora ganbajun]